MAPGAKDVGRRVRVLKSHGAGLVGAVHTVEGYESQTTMSPVILVSGIQDWWFNVARFELVQE